MTTLEQLRIRFNGLTISQKKEFIDNLQQKLKEQNNAEYAQFLNECVSVYTSELLVANPSNPYPNVNNVYAPPGSMNYEMKTHVPSLVLSIVGLVFSLLLPLITYPCSIAGLVLAVNHRSTYKTTAALVMCIIGLVLAVVNSAIGAYLAISGLLF